MVKKLKKTLKKRKSLNKKRVSVQKTSFNPKTFSDGKKSFTNFRGLCKGCGICVEICPQKALRYSKEVGVYKTPAVDCDIEKCVACGLCEIRCPDGAIKVEKLNGKEKDLPRPKARKLLK